MRRIKKSLAVFSVLLVDVASGQQAWTTSSPGASSWWTPACTYSITPWANSPDAAGWTRYQVTGAGSCNEWTVASKHGDLIRSNVADGEFWIHTMHEGAPEAKVSFAIGGVAVDEWNANSAWSGTRWINWVALRSSGGDVALPSDWANSCSGWLSGNSWASCNFADGRLTLAATVNAGDARWVITNSWPRTVVWQAGVR